MKTHQRILASLFGLLFLASRANTFEFNGFTVGQLIYEDGFIEDINGLEWEWTHDLDVTILTLAGRSESTIELCDGDSIRVEIDTFQKVLFLDDGTEIPYLSHNSVPVHGYTIGYCEFSNGRLEQLPSGDWELSKDKALSKLQFYENYRDHWSVYMESEDGLVVVQLDYHRKTISMGEKGRDRHDVFDIMNGDYSTVPYSHGCGTH